MLIKTSSKIVGFVSYVIFKNFYVAKCKEKNLIDNSFVCLPFAKCSGLVCSFKSMCNLCESWKAYWKKLLVIFVWPLAILTDAHTHTHIFDSWPLQHEVYIAFQYVKSKERPLFFFVIQNESNALTRLHLQCLLLASFNSYASAGAGTHKWSFLLWLNHQRCGQHMLILLFKRTLRCVLKMKTSKTDADMRATIDQVVFLNTFSDYRKHPQCIWVQRR